MDCRAHYTTQKIIETMYENIGLLTLLLLLLLNGEILVTGTDGRGQSGVGTNEWLDLLLLLLISLKRFFCLLYEISQTLWQ